MALTRCYLGLLCSDVTRASDTVCQTKVTAGNHGAGHTSFSLTHADVVQKVVAVHGGALLVWMRIVATIRLSTLSMYLQEHFDGCFVPSSLGEAPV